MRVNLLLGFSLSAILIASLHIRRKSSKREASSSEATYLNWIALTVLMSFHVRDLFNHHGPKSRRVNRNSLSAYLIHPDESASQASKRVSEKVGFSPQPNEEAGEAPHRTQTGDYDRARPSLRLFGRNHHESLPRQVRFLPQRVRPVLRLQGGQLHRHLVRQQLEVRRGRLPGTPELLLLDRHDDVVPRREAGRPDLSGWAALRGCAALHLVQERLRASDDALRLPGLAPSLLGSLHRDHLLLPGQTNRRRGGGALCLYHHRGLTPPDREREPRVVQIRAAGNPPLRLGELHLSHAVRQRNETRKPDAQGHPGRLLGGIRDHELGRRPLLKRGLRDSLVRSYLPGGGPPLPRTDDPDLHGLRPLR